MTVLLYGPTIRDAVRRIAFIITSSAALGIALAGLTLWLAGLVAL